MTARKTSQLCEISSHYTCSDTNCNPIQQNTAPINGTACLQQSMSFKRSNGRRAVIVRTFLSLVIAILLVLAAVFLTACGRGAGEFPNIPEVMDECGSWSEEEFASKMNLERNAELSGGSEALPPTWAKDLTSVVGNGDLVTMFLLNDVVTIAITADMHDTTYNTPYQAAAEMRNFIRYDFDYHDAIGVLDLVDIQESSIKVYDDTSSEGNELISSGQNYAMWFYLNQYKMCGETETEDGSPLYFSVSAQAGFSYSSSVGGTEITPVDSIIMRFRTTKPFNLSEEL